MFPFREVGATLLTPLVTVLLASVTLFLPIRAQADTELLVDPGTTDPKSSSLTLEGVQREATDGEGFLPLRFKPGEGPAVTLKPQDGQTWDLSQVKSLKMHLQNTMQWPLGLEMIVIDQAGKRLQTHVGLKPGGPVTFVMPLKATRPLRWGMRAGPPMPIMRNGEPLTIALSTEGGVDLERVGAITLRLPKLQADQVVRVGKLFLEREKDEERLAYEGIVDAFGQYTGADWPGKWAEAPKAAADASDKAEAAHDRTVSTERPFFRVEQVLRADGKGRRWAFITPDGEPTLSLGINAIQLEHSATFIEGREFMFRDLPPADGDMKAFHAKRDSASELAASAGAQKGRGFGSGRSFDFYRANLQRQDGHDFAARWTARTLDRIGQWKFNTIGAWSDARVVDHGALWYSPIVHIDGKFARLSDGRDWWSGIPDPFDPAFEAALRETFEREVAPRKNDRRLIGWFVDNELGWGDGAATDLGHRYALAFSALAGDGHGSKGFAKRQFIEMLKKKYEDPIKLATSWDRPIGSWDAAMMPMHKEALPDPKRPEVAKDLQAFLVAHAERYFELVSKTLKSVDPNHLYLGARFASRTPEAVAACGRYCDVMSFNLYLPSVDVGFETEAVRKLNKPVLLTEFHFGSPGGGPFWPGVMSVGTEAERGTAYAKMIASVVANPDFVGAHWFQYLDQPVTGRYLDGENGHLGLVSITDTPWAGLVEQATVANDKALQSVRRAEESREQAKEPAKESAKGP